MPPAYPHNCPEVPTTRWQGIMTDMGLRPTAEATTYLSLLMVHIDLQS